LGNNSTGQTVNHGLSQAPEFIIVKNVGAAIDWMIYHKSMGATYYGLFGPYEFFNNADIWADTEPTNEHFYVSVHNSPLGYSNGPDATLISYCWHSVPGLQKFGSYTGNGTADNGPFIELGFRPAIIMIKRTTSGSGGFNWTINDSERNKYNPSGTAVFPNLNNIESTNDEYEIDFLSNGFKPRCTTPDSINVSGQTYVYAAWAEAPSFNLYGAQANAR